MKHKAQETLNRLYSLRKGINNNYPYVNKRKEDKCNKDRGIANYAEWFNIPVFMKDSLIPIVGEGNMKRDFPKGLRKEWCENE